MGQETQRQTPQRIAGELNIQISIQIYENFRSKFPRHIHCGRSDNLNHKTDHCSLESAWSEFEASTDSIS